MVSSIPASAGAQRGDRKGRGNNHTRGTLIKLFAVSVVTAVVGVGAVQNAEADTSERNGKGHVEVLELKVQNDQHTPTDLAPSGPSLGDMDVYSGIAVEDGRRVGHGGGTCQVVRVEGTKLTTQCVITLELDRGSLTMQSLWTSGTGSLDMAITGGTGAFSSARGTVRYWDIATPKERLRAEILR